MMNVANFSVDRDKSQKTNKNLVLTLTILVFIFSAYMNVQFLGGIGTTLHAAIIFAAIGVFVEFAKVCAGMVVIGRFVVATMFRGISIFILCIFSSVSFIASTATISSNLSVGKKNVIQMDTTYQLLQANIKRQQDIVDNLLASQKLDVKNGYRARAAQTLQLIMREQQRLGSLQDQAKDFVTVARSSTSVLGAIDNLIPSIAHKLEGAMILILGALTEISGLFLLFLNFSLHKENNHVGRFRIDSKDQETPKSNVNDLPISVLQYKELSAKLLAKQVKPTQRGVKAVMPVGNEKIAKIFAKWIADGVLVREGRGYKLCGA